MFQDGRGAGHDRGVEALPLARHAVHPAARGQPEGGRAVLPVRAGDGHQEGRAHAHRAVRGAVRGRREPAAPVRGVVRAQRGGQAVPLRGRAPLQRVALHPEVLVLVRPRALPALRRHGDAAAADRGTLLRARLRRLVHGLCESARRL